ncbi:hypothetical protein PR003_g18417 [Phytophthora rubi]|uniref:Uncharacterized protein n=1 Tax=Phytophthora rubi TaxID=129364 RepID=A0A6A3K7S0_9STRA|nr:hypothetical protein PR002_g17619 [Phytophthora rubi]KAE9005171.1 hypothetical protein PR001_g17523 [Phytophthora rubi]KAE9317712.1 hypothetical protein PR003_g18417 [Phytophthora rubi]
MAEQSLAVLVAPTRPITPTLEWLCLTGNSMTERTSQEFVALPQNVIAIELQDKGDEETGDVDV